MRMKAHILSVALAAIPVLACAAATTTDAPRDAFGAASPLLSACRLPDVQAQARCGSFDVPENPDRPDGRHLAIRVAVMPARNAPAQRDPILIFSGGPGEGAIALASDVGVQLSELIEDRDILLIDQRGTGQSAPLPCPLYSERDAAANLVDLFPPAAILRCLKTLSARADLTQYSFARFADDVEHIRRALGYGPVDAYALSFGTRAAQIYMRAYPGSVRTAYLGSVVPADIATPLQFARASEPVLDETLDACAHDEACHAAFPNLRAETREIFARLGSGSVRARAPNSDQDTVLNAGRIAERIRTMMYRPRGAANLPWTIHRAWLGDWQPFVDGIVAGARDADADIDWGLFFSITCNEDVAFIKEAEIAPAVKDTVLGDFRVRQQQAACAKWPKFSVAPGYRDAVRSAVPTMIVSGDLDPATPLSFTEHLAPGFSRRVEIVLRGQGHTGWSDCVADAYRNFVRKGSPDGIASTCPVTPRPPFKTG